MIFWIDKITIQPSIYYEMPEQVVRERVVKKATMPEDDAIALFDRLCEECLANPDKLSGVVIIFQMNVITSNNPEKNKVAARAVIDLLHNSYYDCNDITTVYCSKNIQLACDYEEQITGDNQC